MIRRFAWLLLALGVCVTFTACGEDTEDTYKCGTNEDGSPITCIIGSSEPVVTKTSPPRPRKSTTPATTVTTETTQKTIEETITVNVTTETRTHTVTTVPPPVTRTVQKHEPTLLTLSSKGGQCGGTQVLAGETANVFGMTISLTGGGPNYYQLEFSMAPPFPIAKMLVQTQDVPDAFSGYETFETFSNEVIGTGSGQNLAFYIDTGKYIQSITLCPS